MMQRGFANRQAGHATRSRGALRVDAVASPSKAPTSRLAKRSKVEIIKEKSDFLRHPLMEELKNDNSFISEEAVQLMKFHGSYQQDHREKRSFGAGKAYMFMMRTRQPAGAVTNQLYLAMDDLADLVRGGALGRDGRGAWARSEGVRG
jgi:sulfite reductase (ferredoxin)